jgi:hypothetical protein
MPQSGSRIVGVRSTVVVSTSGEFTLDTSIHREAPVRLPTSVDVMNPERRAGHRHAFTLSLALRAPDNPSRSESPEKRYEDSPGCHHVVVLIAEPLLRRVADHPPAH